MNILCPYTTNILRHVLVNEIDKTAIIKIKRCGIHTSETSLQRRPNDIEVLKQLYCLQKLAKPIPHSQF